MSKDHKQSWPSWLVAVATMTIYTGWLHVLLGLMLGALFRRWCLCVLLALFATTFLPAKPVLWTAFCQSRVFRTWREYFSYSFLNEALLDAKKHYIFVEVLVCLFAVFCCCFFVCLCVLCFGFWVLLPCVSCRCDTLPLSRSLINST